MKTLKKLASHLIIAALSLGLMQVTALGADTTASVMRLDSFEGTITVKNSSGREIKASENMRLLNGYTIETDEKSYAYVSLDETKAVKLDALTECKIQSKGEKIEILLSEGELFFNVTAPLKESETMNIRTSTMVTGIRGTSGFVSLIEETNDDGDTSNKCVVSLLTGKVEVTHIEPETADVNVSIITPGQMAVLTSDEAKTPETFEIIEATVEEIPGFVAVEIAKDENLIEEITKQSTIDVQAAVENSKEKLETEEKEQEVIEAKKEEAIKEEAAKEEAEETKENVFEDNSQSSSSGSSSGGSSNDDDDDDDSSTPTPPPVEPQEEVILTNPNAEAVATALSEGHKNVVVSGSMTGSANFEVLDGQTLVFIDEGTPYTRSTNMAILEELVVNDGASVEIRANYIVTVNSAVHNMGEIIVNGELNPAGLTNEENATFTMNANSKVSFAQKDVTNEGDITINSTAAWSGSNAITNDGSITNYGTLNSGSGVILNNGKIYNHNYINTAGELTNNDLIENRGTSFLVGEGVENYSSIINEGSLNTGLEGLINSGTFENSGTFVFSTEIDNTGLLINESTINGGNSYHNILGYIKNSGTFVNKKTVTAYAFENTEDDAMFIQYTKEINGARPSVNFTGGIDRANGIFMYEEFLTDTSGFSNQYFIMESGEYNDFKGYASTLEKLMSNAPDGANITLIGSYSINEEVEIENDITLDLSDEILTLFAPITVSNGADVTITGVDANSQISSSITPIKVNDATLTASKISIINTDGQSAVYLNNNAEFILESATIKSYGSGEESATIDLNSGSTFKLNQGMVTNVADTDGNSKVLHVFSLSGDSIVNITGFDNTFIDYAKGYAIVLLEDAGSEFRFTDENVMLNARGSLQDDIYIEYDTGTEKIQKKDALTHGTYYYDEDLNAITSK